MLIAWYFKLRLGLRVDLGARAAPGCLLTEKSV